jgi:hypothetical protein
VEHQKAICAGKMHFYPHISDGAVGLPPLFDGFFGLYDRIICVTAKNFKFLRAQNACVDGLEQGVVGGNVR